MSSSVERVGIRDLRQNLSVHLKKVLKGKTLEVTEHGHPIAMLIPIPSSDRPVDRLIAAGRARPPDRSLADLPPPKGRVSTRLSRALEKERAERL